MKSNNYEKISTVFLYRRQTAWFISLSVTKKRNSEELLAAARAGRRPQKWWPQRTLPCSTEMMQRRHSQTSPSNVYDTFDFSETAIRYFGCIILTRLPSVSNNDN